MNQFHNKLKTPLKPGTYWVVDERREPRSPTGVVTVLQSDSGYAKWDGLKWDREDFDSWYGESKSGTIESSKEN